MNIIETNLNFKQKLLTRSQTSYIILHHRAGNGDVISIHNQHLKQGDCGIGYHFYIRKDGKIYSARPVGTIGAHCVNYNNKSIGICFEGNFEIEKMCDAQKNAGAELVNYLKSIYKNAMVVRHKDMNATACPGKNFPYDEISREKSPKKDLTSANDIIWELMNGKLKIQINDVNKAVKCLEQAKQQDHSLYWILYKIVNKE